jgi:hypothetical protein
LALGGNSLPGGSFKKRNFKRFDRGCKKPVRCCEGERGWTGKFRGLLVVAALETGQGLIGKDL